MRGCRPGWIQSAEMEATRRMAKSRSLASTKSGALSFSITSILSSGELDGEDEEEIDVGNEDAETDDERVTCVQGRVEKHNRKAYCS